MKTSMFEKGIPMLSRATILGGALFAVLSLAGPGCIGGLSDTNVSEGDRCNPLDSHNECASGLVCTGQGSSPTIPFCAENYCCSVDGNGNINSQDLSCQPGCNGGAASICKANGDPGACAFADGGTLQASLLLDEDGGATSDDAATDAATKTDAVATTDAAATTVAAATPDAVATPDAAATPDASATPDAAPLDAGLIEGGD